MAIDDEVFQTLLEQVRELHRRTDEITSSKTRMHDHIRARLSWNVPPSLPSAQRDLADEVVAALGNARPSTVQSRQLWRAYFGKWSSARSGVDSKPLYRFAMSFNRGLDHDKDGVACEKA